MTCRCKRTRFTNTNRTMRTDKLKTMEWGMSLMTSSLSMRKLEISAILTEVSWILGTLDMGRESFWRNLTLDPIGSLRLDG